MDELLKWREEFPILARTTYMISNSLGAMPRGVYDCMREYADAWATRGVRAWEEGWWDMAVRVGDRIGALVGAAPGDISLHQNVTLTQAAAPCQYSLSRAGDVIGPSGGRLGFDIATLGGCGWSFPIVDTGGTSLSKTYNGNTADTGYPVATEFLWDPWAAKIDPCCYLIDVRINDRAIINNSWSGGHPNENWRSITIA